MFKRNLTILTLGVVSLSMPSYAADDDLFNMKIRMIQHLALNPLLVKAVRLQDVKELGDYVNKPLAHTPTQELTQSTPVASEPDESLATMSDNQIVIEKFIAHNSDFTNIVLKDMKGNPISWYPESAVSAQQDQDNALTFEQGSTDQVFIGKMEWEESANAYKTYISAPVKNRDETVGVVTVGLLVEPH